MDIKYFLVCYYDGHTSVTTYGSLDDLNDALADARGVMRVKIISGYLLEDRV